VAHRRGFENVRLQDVHLPQGPKDMQATLASTRSNEHMVAPPPASTLLCRRSSSLWRTRCLGRWMAQTFFPFLLGLRPFRHPNLDFQERRVPFDIRASAIRLTHD
jgi:hypothetical protein